MRDEPYPRFRKAILLSLRSATWVAAIVSLAAYAMPETAWSPAPGVVFADYPWWMLAVPAFVVTFVFAFVIVAFRPSLGRRVQYMRDEPYPRFRKAAIQSSVSATLVSAIVSLMSYAALSSLPGPGILLAPPGPWWVLSIPTFVVTFAFAFVIVAFRPSIGRR